MATGLAGRGRRKCFRLPSHAPGKVHVLLVHKDSEGMCGTSEAHTCGTPDSHQTSVTVGARGHFFILNETTTVSVTTFTTLP